MHLQLPPLNSAPKIVVLALGGARAPSAPPGYACEFRIKYILNRADFASLTRNIMWSRSHIGLKCTYQWTSTQVPIFVKTGRKRCRLDVGAYVWSGGHLKVTTKKERRARLSEQEHNTTKSIRLRVRTRPVLRRSVSNNRLTCAVSLRLILI